MNREETLINKLETNSLTIKSKKITNIHIKYEYWIKENYPTPESARCKCESASHKMIEEFPELTVHRGYYKSNKILSQHWWCQTLQDEIVDPTVHQWYENDKNASYHELTEEEIKELVPIKKCPICRFSIYENENFCSEDCEKESEFSGQIVIL